jgi:hypothetical protein
MNRYAISALLIAVTSMRTIEIPYGRRSFLLVSRASFRAATAMMAITTGAMP